MLACNVNAVLFACATLVAGGCYSGMDGGSGGGGADDAGPDGGDDDAAADGGDGADDGGDGADDGADDGASAGDCNGFDSALRRLNLREYEAALQALLGDDVVPGDAFPDDALAAGFDIDAGVLPVSDVWLSAHAKLTEATVTAALEPGSPVRDSILVCTPQSPDAEPACAEQILAAFGRRAWRRPVTDAELADLLGFREVAAAEGDGFEQAIALALEAMLMSPNFVFKVEQTDSGVVSGYELATRLAFFLWSQPPDDLLLDAAESGDLDTEAGLYAELDRMLADPRAASLTDGFATQWLQLEHLDDYESPAGAGAASTWDDALHDAMAAESRATFAAALAEDRTLAELVSSPQILVNETLAAHYGIEGVEGPELVWVDGAPANRHGLITQGAILTLSSHPGQSSPTRRGLWVTDRLLCAPPPPPPADVDNTLPEPTPGGEPQTIREFLEQTHLADPSCAGCHEYLDPVGFALETYDATGAYRTAYPNGSPISTLR